MTTEAKVLVPDIGDFEGVEVIEVLVAPGDQVAAEDSLITLESDKATMEIPSPQAGEVKEVIIKVGDKVAVGDLILILEEKVSTQGQEAPQGIPDESPQPPQSLEAPGPSIPAPVRSGTVLGCGRSGAFHLSVRDVGAGCR